MTDSISHYMTVTANHTTMDAGYMDDMYSNDPLLTASTMMNQTTTMTTDYQFEFDFSQHVLRTTQDGASFVVTNQAFDWVPLSLFFTALYLTAYYQMPQFKASYKQMAMTAFAASLFLVVPFVAYFMTGITWTGLNLSAIHRQMIDKRHAVLMSLWMVFSLVQLVTYILKKQKLHNAIGRFVVNYLLALIFLELFGNAVFVFWPEKPYILAMGVASANGLPVPASHHALSYGEKLLYTLPSLTALATPINMLMYYCLSNRALDRSNGRKRDIRLHVVFMCCFLYSTLSAGSLRWLIRKSFQSSHCQPQGDTTIAVLNQFMGQVWAGYIYTALLTAIYLTLPVETRRNNPSVKYSFFFYVGLSTFVTPMSGWWANLPMGIQCVS